MRIVRAFPPNFKRLIEHFPIQGKPGILYAFGDVLYNPSGVKIPKWVMRHEEVHGKQQNIDGVADWWDRYILNPAFRLDEELLAHRAEWQSYQGYFKAKHARNTYLHKIAVRLSSPLYGNLIDYDRAVKEISDVSIHVHRQRPDEESLGSAGVGCGEPSG